ncbi:mitochondrial import protein Pam17-domain-containing protein [Cladorrhinum sp. PSN332]|nr:mitochondrial import protein Pam17-domain-containing protein [Cladorrhinum sp. PSN332]
MITPTASTMLRASAAGGLQPMLLRTTACPYSAGLNNLAIFPKTSSSSSSSSSRPLSPSRKTKPVPSSATTSSTLIQYRLPVSRRNASTTASTGTPSSPSSEPIHLNWETFFKLRKTRRRWQQTFSIIGSAGAGGVGSVALSTGLADPVVTQIPLDPLITLGLLSMSCAALGWLAGPSLGSAVFNAMNSKYKEPMAEKEKEFFARIKKNRVDPTASSVRNPVPDFYGEKISSVAGYRQWLRDQRAFNRKKTGF